MLLSLQSQGGAASDASVFEGDAVYCNAHPSPSALTATWAKSRVAFVFAGAARSFAFPIVHETLRRNLVASFCTEEDGCVRDIFIRMSTADNMHKAGSNAEGIPKAAVSGDMPAVLAALTKLQPLPLTFNKQDVKEGTCKVQFRQIGVAREKLEKETAHFAVPGSRYHTEHKVFRELDPRRYSMYFNRWSAYQLALQEEARHGTKYDFFVHVRLDVTWGEPVPPVQMWDPSKVWVHDSWYSEVPDTFAIMARQWSDSFWSMDDLVAEGAMCLGGPNFDPKTLELAHLPQILQWTNGSKEMDVVRKRDCFHMFPVAHNNYDKHRDRYWSQAGVSEKIMRRKLEKAVVPIGYNEQTLGYTAMFMVLTRKPLSLYCFYLSQSYVIGWIRKTNMGSTAIHVGCLNLLDDLISDSKTKLLSTDMVTDVSLSGSSSVSIVEAVPCSNRPYFLGAPDYACHTSDLHLSTSGSDAWYFMPYRIHPRPALPVADQVSVNSSSAAAVPDVCLTAAPRQTARRDQEGRPMAVAMQSCENVVRELDIFSWYHERQLWNFHPLRTHPQPIRYWSRQDNHSTVVTKYCLAVSNVAVVEKTKLPKWELNVESCTQNVMPKNSRLLFFLSTQGRDRRAPDVQKVTKKNSGGALVVAEWAGNRNLCVNILATPPTLTNCTTTKAKKRLAFSVERASSHGPARANVRTNYIGEDAKAIITSLKSMPSTLY